MLRVLVQHKRPELRQDVAEGLTAAGMLVQQAGDGVEGLALLGQERFDVIITGINMPQLDGFGFLAAMRQDETLRNTPVLVLTTNATPEMRARARSAGAMGWLCYPQDAAKLAATVRAVCV